MKPIELEIYFMSQEAIELDKLGLEYEDKPELRSATFYSIEHIIKYIPDVNLDPATRIISGGCDYLVAMDYESLKSLINEHI